MGESLGAVRFAHVVVLMLDSKQGLDKQDLDIARHVLEEGRNLIIALNKWDAVQDGQAALKIHRRQPISIVTQAKGVPVTTLSALHGKNLHRILDSAVALYAPWRWRLATAELNNWLQVAVDKHPHRWWAQDVLKFVMPHRLRPAHPPLPFLGRALATCPNLISGI